ncbi:GspI family T2SS minor pseudopilin variant XcpV [soil metagenome]
MNRARGFTLVEVLVALVIVGVTLSAAIRATTGMIRNNEALRLKLFAEWSAENRLVELRASGLYPAVGTTEFNCPQGRAEMVCTQVVQATPNPTMRRVEVHVYADASREFQLASLSTVVANAR